MKKFTLVGCGLLGSMAAYPLGAHIASLGIDAAVTLIDHDAVEERNAPANLLTVANNGALKVNVVAEVLAGYGVKYHTKNSKVTDKNVWVLGRPDIIIGAVDNIDTRKILLGIAESSGVAYMDMGLSEYSGIVSWYNRGTTNMPLAVPDFDHKMPDEQDKIPPCTLVGTRAMSSIVTELAMKSLFIWAGGHDPSYAVNAIAGRDAQAGDMVAWNVVGGSGQLTAIPQFVGNVGV